jgi:hypothetical protein
MSNKFNLSFDEFLKKLEDLIKEGNLRRIIVRDQNGEKYIEMPLLVGFIGSLAAPYITLIGVLAGVAAKFTVEIIKKDEQSQTEIYEVTKED